MSNIEVDDKNTEAARLFLKNIFPPINVAKEIIKRNNTYKQITLEMILQARHKTRYLSQLSITILMPEEHNQWFGLRCVRYCHYSWLP